MLLILFPGYNDEKATWKSYFISKLKKIGDVYYPPDINQLTEVSIKKYIKDLRFPKSDKIILIAHSIGLWFAYEFAKIHKVDKIVSLDGTLIGKYIQYAVDRVLNNPKAEPLLKYLVKQAPLKATKFPVKTICFRNIVSRNDLKEKEIVSNKQAILESYNIKNYTVIFYVNKTHYLQDDRNVMKDIIYAIKN